MFYVQSQVHNKWVDSVSTTSLDAALNIAKHYSPSQVVSRVNTDLGIIETLVSSSQCESCH